MDKEAWYIVTVLHLAVYLFFSVFGGRRLTLKQIRTGASRNTP